MNLTILWRNLEKSDINRGYRPQLTEFNENYISANPKITIFDINSNDIGVLLASDGLWDILKPSHISGLIKYNKSKYITNELIKMIKSKTILIV